MGTRTLSVDDAAYERLRRARLHPKESFSKVIKRAKWDSGKPRCAHVLRRAEGLPLLYEATLAYLEQAQAEDHPPLDPWKR
jgi:predicted CopG family antitoxin